MAKDQTIRFEKLSTVLINCLPQFIWVWETVYLNKMVVFVLKKKHFQMVVSTLLSRNIHFQTNEAGFYWNEEKDSLVIYELIETRKNHIDICMDKCHRSKFIVTFNWWKPHFQIEINHFLSSIYCTISLTNITFT